MAFLITITIIENILKFYSELQLTNITIYFSILYYVYDTLYG